MPEVVTPVVICVAPSEMVEPKVGKISFKNPAVPLELEPMMSLKKLSAAPFFVEDAFSMASSTTSSRFSFSSAIASFASDGMTNVSPPVEGAVGAGGAAGEDGFFASGGMSKVSPPVDGAAGAAGDDAFFAFSSSRRVKYATRALSSSLAFRCAESLMEDFNFSNSSFS